MALGFSFVYSPPPPPHIGAVGLAQTWSYRSVITTRHTDIIPREPEKKKKFCTLTKTKFECRYPHPPFMNHSLPLARLVLPDVGL